MPPGGAPGPSPQADAPDERRHLTVLFSDLVGSTELASSMDPEDWHEVLTAYHSSVATVIGEHGGSIAQFQGDGVVAYFGYPEAHDTDARNAVEAGLALAAAVRELAGQLPPELGLGALGARVGVHSGEVVMSSVRAGGAPRIADVFGEVPNLTARLQTAGQAGDVLISDTTAQLVAGYFETEFVGDLELKGISRPIPTSRVLHSSAARGRLDTGPLTGFVDRPQATAWLLDHWRATAAGPSRVVLVSGEAGIGKSRLLQQFASEAEERGHQVHALYCNHLNALSPLRPFEPAMGGVPLTPDIALQWVLERAQDRRTLLLLEDVHWADPSTMEVVEQLNGLNYPLLVVATARLEFVERSTTPAAHHLTLEPLGVDDALAVVTKVPGAEQLDARTQRALVDRAGGVPLFLEELVRATLDQAASPSAGENIPITLTDVIGARLDRLGASKRVAQSAAIVGRSFELDVLVEVVGMDRDTVDPHLRYLIEQAVIEDPDGDGTHLWFRHALIHEAAYRSVLRADRRQGHATVADTLIASGRVEDHPETVAYHLGASGRNEEAAAHWRLAARAARHRARFHEAAGHEREILELVPKLPDDQRDPIELGARSRLTMCLTAVDQTTPEVIVHGERTQELARQLDDRLTLLRSLLVLLPWWQANADYHAIDRVLPEANALAAELADDWARSTLTQYEGAVRIWQGRPHEGVGLLEQSFEAAGLPLSADLIEAAPPAHPMGDLVIATTRIGAALGCWLAGRLTDADRIRDQLLHFAAVRSAPQAQTVTAATGAIFAQLDGDRALVGRLTVPTSEVRDDVAARQFQRWGTMLRWWSGFGAEEPEIPGPLLRPYFLAVWADREGLEPAAAQDALQEALEVCRDRGERFCEPEILRVMGSVTMRAGDDGRADALLAESADVAQELRMPVLELRARTDRSLLPGAADERQAELAVCLDALGDEGPSLSVARARTVLARP